MGYTTKETAEKLKISVGKVNSIFIEKVEAEIKTINSVKKVISNNN